MRLKGALLWSVLLHAGLLIARPPGAIVSAQKISRAVELTFVPTFAAHEAAPRVVQASVPVAAAAIGSPALRDISGQKLRGSGTTSASSVAAAAIGSGTTSASSVAAPILMAAGGAAPLPKADPPREVLRLPQLPKLSLAKLPRIQEPQPTAAAKKVEVQAATLPEKEFAQLAYRKQLREHLKKYLLYPSGSVEGMIRLRLALSPTGTLKQALIVEASDAQLAAACLEGVQSASPYPPVPKEMADAEAQYEFLVQYRSN